MADTIYAFFEETKNDERKRVVKDFCFPCGIHLIPQNSFEDVKKVMIKDIKATSRSTFVFSLSGANPADNVIFSEIYCMCT